MIINHKLKALPNSKSPSENKNETARVKPT